MPSLVLTKSPVHPPPFEEIVLPADSQVLGRTPDRCDIVLVGLWVSKRHARVFHDNGTVFIEDLKSHNGTYLNGKRLEPFCPHPLTPDDDIRICDFHLQYCPDEAPVAVVHSREILVAPIDRLKALMTFGAGTDPLGPFLDHVAKTLFDTDPSQVLELDALLGQLADALLEVFAHADRCHLLLHDEYGRPHPRATRCRRKGAGERRYSRGAVKIALGTMRSHLFEDLPGSSGAEPRSVMCVPLTTSEGRALGAIQLETCDRAVRFSPDDLGLLGVVANLASVAVEREQKHAREKAQALAQSEIELARRVQLELLPQTLPAVPGYEFYAHYSAATGVGGDFYDFIPLHDGRLAVVLGDVAGHGVPAALLVAKLTVVVRACLLAEPDPAKAVTRLNDQMIREGTAGKFITVVVLVLDPAAHQLAVVNAGHTVPKLYSSATGRLTDLIPAESGDLVIGVERGYEYSAVTVPLAPGDTVTAYTDGVTDATDPAGVAFGLPALEHCLTPRDDPGAARPRRVGQTIVRAVQRHIDGRHQFDDIAVVCFGRWGPSSDSSSTLNGKTQGPPRE